MTISGNRGKVPLPPALRVPAWLALAVGVVMLSGVLFGALAGVPNKDLPTGMTMEELEKLAIQKALEQSGGKRTRAAESLGISVRTLQRKLRQYQMEGAEPEPHDAGTTIDVV